MKKAIIITVASLIVLVLFLGYYADWLWFKSLAFETIFLKILYTKIAAFLLFGLIFFVIVGGNFKLAWRNVIPQGFVNLPEGWTRRLIGTLVTVFVIFFTLIAGGTAASRWEMFLKYLNPQSFGTTDPIFGRDIGFYVFTFPAYQFVQNWLVVSLVLSIFGVIGIYFLTQAIGLVEGRLQVMPYVRIHLSALMGALFLVLAWGYRLHMYKLLYSKRGVAFGANFTDVNIQLPIYWIMLILVVIIALIMMANIWLRRPKILWLGPVVYFGAAFVLRVFPAAIVQKFNVQPNELRKEAPYIQRNIEATRQAYGLEEIVEKDFPAAEDLTLADIERNDLTIKNIRIWDERPLLRTYSQLQEIRLYYDFANVDVDRYYFNGQYRQVMLSPRELVVEQIPKQVKTWVNQYLQYTHGYGLVLSPVNQVTEEGLPALLVKDIPPVALTNLNITRPEIYYGELTKEYVIVKTKAPEFDYPKGDENQYTTYQGAGGASVGSALNRLAFATKFFDINILLSGYITGESRILMNRTIRQRLNAIAPFLKYDRDPYMVISDDGRLFWIQDAYTISNRYPYSTRFNGESLNYIRNSVKVVIDAYNGTVNFYVIDVSDPLVRSYQKIFPRLFQSFDKMPEDLLAHLRYPKDLFKIQALMYRIYHMQNVRVFYNREDLWEIPNEMYSDNIQRMEPYYIIVRLPGEVREEFLLMLPFTPSQKDNMIAWLAARSDPGVYGQMLVYKLPKDKLIFGPMQIEARVDQQTEISRELTLWGQRGSRVIRGNLLVIPIEQSFIYVEPVYLEARQEQEGVPQMQPGQERRLGRQRARQVTRAVAGSASLPELKMVIAAYGNRLAMREDLGQALSAVFGEAPTFVAEVETPKAKPLASVQLLPSTLQELAVKARDHYRKARRYLKEENWAGFGQEWQELQKVLDELNSKLAAAPKKKP